MIITSLGHSAVLLETEHARILLDPGNFSDAWHGLTDLDAIVVTHLHPDHIDPVHLPRLLEANPEAALWVEPQVATTYDLPRAVAFGAGDSHQRAGLNIAAVGGEHAVIHRDIAMVGNIGLVVSAPGEPTFFHPGDSLAAIPAGIDVVAIPAYGPWAAMKETIDFVRGVAARQGMLIHDGLLNDRGRALIAGRVQEMTETELLALELGQQHQIA